jgi:hypothetical protein
MLLSKLRRAIRRNLMYQVPKALKQGQFFSEPDDMSRRNLRLTYTPLLHSGERAFISMTIERAEVPDLIKLLQDSYGL